MKKLQTLIITYIDKLFKNSSFRINAKVLWMEVPTICNCRKDKDEIIMTTIEHLEQNIKIK